MATQRNEALPRDRQERAPRHEEGKNLTRPKPAVRGLHARSPQLTATGAALIALAIALPVGGALWVVEILFF